MALVLVVAAALLLVRAGENAAGWASRHLSLRVVVVAAVVVALAALLAASAVRASQAAKAREAEARLVEQRQRAVSRRLSTWWDGLSPAQFEREVAVLLRRDGCREVRVCGGAGDGGVDVEGVAPDGRRFVVQCKRYHAEHYLKATEVRDFIGAGQLRRAPLLLFVSTSGRIGNQAAGHARQGGVVVVLRARLLQWASGTPLTEVAARPAARGG